MKFLDKQKGAEDDEYRAEVVNQIIEYRLIEAIAWTWWDREHKDGSCKIYLKHGFSKVLSRIMQIGFKESRVFISQLLSCPELLLLLRSNLLITNSYVQGEILSLHYNSLVGLISSSCDPSAYLAHTDILA